MASNDVAAAELQPGGKSVPKGTPVFPLFDPQKRKEIMQQKQVSSKPKRPRGARATTPTSLSDTEKGEPEVVVTTSVKPRKPRSKSTVAKGAQKPKRRVKEDPDGDFAGTRFISSKSAKKGSGLIVETTTPTLLTPTSSPPPMDGIEDNEDMIDPNQERRKRRRKTPIATPTIEDEGEQDFDVDSLPPPSAQVEVLTSDIGDLWGVQDPEVRSLAIRECPSPKFEVEVPVAKVNELPLASSKPNAFKVLMLKKKKEEVIIEDEPELPQNLPGPPVEAPLAKRTPVSFDPNTGILIIRSSPILLPSSPPLVPALNLGKKKRERRKKKKDEEIPELSLPEPSFPESSRETVSTKRKNTTVKFDPGTGILTIRSSPIIGPQSPELKPKSAFSILGKKKGAHPPPIQAQPPPPPAPLPTVTMCQAPRKVAADQPKKTVHPFFQPGGLKKVPGVVPPPTEIQSDAEDLVPIISRSSIQPKNHSFVLNQNTENSKSWPSGGSGGGGGLGSALSPTSNRILKTPGLIDAPWPSKDSCHARGLLATPLTRPTIDPNEELKAERKLKDRAVAISSNEDLLLKYSCKLSIQEQKQDIIAPGYDVRQYYNIPSDVRLPERIVTTGSKLQEMVRKRISARLPHPNSVSRGNSEPASDSDNELNRAPRKKVHPALLKLYSRMRDELTPFDKAECEPSSWEVKYAPGSSQEVMQIGKETQILKDWLMALKVESVSVSTNSNGKRKPKSSTPSGAGTKGGATKKKRKKKKDDELASFIIDSDEEKNEMDEVTDPEDNDWMSAPSGVKKSTIRAGDKGVDSPFGGLKESVRLVNAVVISGPNGCGKTAAVYAVAREVGFTVFEVSPGTRRSGKDILDQVGEMSRTHLVHQAKAVSQGATSFFKPKTVRKLQAEEDVLPKVAPVQQQSLILLEEVDLLFEEDKQFWSTVLALMAQSKRPIVLTCNDENLLPLDTLPLHAILRFTPPPRELLVDQLLLMCANEGHLLQRDAVESLVKSHKGDLRASLVELEFWCRMAVGDRKGGMDWMIIRWPIGVDTAENGETLRVVSKDTYFKGMGFVDGALRDEGEYLRNVWETWGVDVGGEDGGIGKLKQYAEEVQGERVEKIVALRVCDEYAEAMSAVDCYAGVSMRSFDEPIMDITQPRLSSKIRIDDTQGYPILQTDPVVSTYSVGVEMATSVRLLARKYLCGTARYKKFTEEELVDIIAERSEIRQRLKPLPQHYIGETFRPLSYASTIFASTPAVCHSSVNGPPSVLMLDVAPYVREIIRHDVKRERERVKASLLSTGSEGKLRKKRVTNASRVAAEGGDRRRKERWLTDVNAALVENSGGVWGGLGLERGEKTSIVDGGIGVEVDEDGNVQGGMGSDEDGEYELVSE